MNSTKSEHVKSECKSTEEPLSSGPLFSPMKIGKSNQYNTITVYYEGYEEYKDYLDNLDLADTGDIDALKIRSHAAWDDILTVETLLDLNRILLVEPADPLVLNNRGVCYDELGGLDLAEADFRSALRADKNCWVANLNLGLSMASRDENQSAIEFFLRSESDTRESASVQYRIAMCYCGMGDWQQAVTHFDKAMALKPYYSIVATERSKALSHMSETKLNEVCRQYNGHIKGDPHRLTFHE